MRQQISRPGYVTSDGIEHVSRRPRNPKNGRKPKALQPGLCMKLLAEALKQAVDEGALAG